MSVRYVSANGQKGVLLKAADCAEERNVQEGFPRIYMNDVQVTEGAAGAGLVQSHTNEESRSLPASDTEKSLISWYRTR
jgi:hypothetical protein